MFGLGTGEIFIVMVLALIFIGPERLPGMATKIGNWVRDFKKSLEDVKNDLLDPPK